MVLLGYFWGPLENFKVLWRTLDVLERILGFLGRIFEVLARTFVVFRWTLVLVKTFEVLGSLRLLVSLRGLLGSLA